MKKNKQFSRRKEVLKLEMSRFFKSRRAKGFHKIAFSIGLRAIQFFQYIYPLNDKLFENKDVFAFIESCRTKSGLIRFTVSKHVIRMTSITSIR